jgi:hypothetical protein
VLQDEVLVVVLAEILIKPVGVGGLGTYAPDAGATVVFANGAGAAAGAQSADAVPLVV